MRVITPASSPRSLMVTRALESSSVCSVSREEGGAEREGCESDREVGKEREGPRREGEIPKEPKEVRQ